MDIRERRCEELARLITSHDRELAEKIHELIDSIGHESKPYKIKWEERAFESLDEAWAQYLEQVPHEQLEREYWKRIEENPELANPEYTLQHMYNENAITLESTEYWLDENELNNFRTDLCTFVKRNPELTLGELRDIVALKPGEAVMIGGGATGTFVLRRLS